MTDQLAEFRQRKVARRAPAADPFLPRWMALALVATEMQMAGLTLRDVAEFLSMEPRAAMRAAGRTDLPRHLHPVDGGAS